MKYQIILHITVSIICALETRQLGYTLHLWCLGNLVCIKISLKKYSHYQKLKIFSSASYKTWNNQDLKLFQNSVFFVGPLKCPRPPVWVWKAKFFLSICEILKQAPASKKNIVWMNCLRKNMPGRLINSRTSLKSHIWWEIHTNQTQPGSLCHFKRPS